MDTFITYRGKSYPQIALIYKIKSSFLPKIWKIWNIDIQGLSLKKNWIMVSISPFFRDRSGGKIEIEKMRELDMSDYFREYAPVFIRLQSNL